MLQGRRQLMRLPVKCALVDQLEIQSWINAYGANLSLREPIITSCYQIRTSSIWPSGLGRWNQDVQHTAQSGGCPRCIQFERAWVVGTAAGWQ